MTSEFNLSHKRGFEHYPFMSEDCARMRGLDGTCDRPLSEMWLPLLRLYLLGDLVSTVVFQSWFLWPGSYVYQHFRESVSDQSKSPEVTTLPLRTKSARLEIGYSGISFCLTQGLCGKNELFLDLSRSAMQSLTPPINTLNHLNLAHSHSSFLLQKSSFFLSFMLSDFSFPSCCLRGSLPLSLLKTSLIFLDVSMKKIVKVNSLLLFEIIKSFLNRGFQSDKVLQECHILLLANGASHDIVQLGFVSKHMFMLPLRIWKNWIGLK